LNEISGKKVGTGITTQYGYSYVNTISGILADTQINNTYGGDSGTLYEILTYYFHVNPDYTRKNIENLIIKILDEYWPYPRKYNRRPKKTVINSRRPRKTVKKSKSYGNRMKTSSKSNKTANISKAKASKAASKAARESNIIKKRLNSQILNSQSNIHMDESI